MVTEAIGQWIPNISQLINRIGAVKPTGFEVQDLTSRYYQASLHLESFDVYSFPMLRRDLRMDKSTYVT